MHVFSFLMHYLTLRGAHNKQKRTALHMLTASGVVRPGHLELSYPTHRQRYPRPRAADRDRASADAP